jgi:hypothetical protein
MVLVERRTGSCRSREPQRMSKRDGSFALISFAAFAAFAFYVRREVVVPPRIDPSAPRRMARPTPEPTDRAALFAAD